MKQSWLSAEECTGCGLCENVCPVDAVVMKEDSCGFAYPSFNSNCIDCNLCQKKCEGRIAPGINNSENPAVFAAWSNDEKIRFTSTSGGLFPELAKAVLERGGYIAGAVYDKTNAVVHYITNSYSDLYRLQQSKYVQSNTLLVYKQVRKLIDKGETVLFCGTPCQVAALQSMFDNTEPQNLYTIDFICRGVNSPKALRSWLSEIEKKENSKVKRVWFKYKVGGWKTSPKRTRLDLSDGRQLVLENEDNSFMHGYLTSNLYIRSSCGACKFKGLPRKADITLADFWGIDGSLDDDKGTSLVLLNNSHGRELFETIKPHLFFQQRKMDEIIEGNVCFSGSVSVPINSKTFLEELGDNNFSKVLSKYMKQSIYKRVLGKFKGYIKSIIRYTTRTTS